MLALMIALSVSAADTLPPPARPWVSLTPAGIAHADTTRPRAKAVEVSDWYATRLSIHKAASWAMIPLFVGQYYTGQTLINQGTDAPEWVKRTHPVLATGVLALFATNTVTGVWNLVETRDNEKGRVWRTTHAILMLASDAGFAYVGQLSRTAKTSGDIRNQHRTAAILSGSAALASYIMMLSPIRRD